MTIFTDSQYAVDDVDTTINSDIESGTQGKAPQQHSRMESITDTEDTQSQSPKEDAVTDNNRRDENDNDNSTTQSTTINKKTFIAIVLVAFIVFIIVDSLTNRYVVDATTSFLDWVEANPAAGFFAFVAVYFAATVLFIPGSLLTLGSGFVFANVFGLGFGVVLASFAVFVGASAGATVAFLLGRFLLRDWVKTLTSKYPIFKAIDTALEDKGWRIMALLRLSPIIPFNALNYSAGVTAVSISDFVGALVALLPGTVFYVFLGATAGSLSDSSSSGSGGIVTIVSIVVGLVFGVLAIATTSYYAKKELNKLIGEDEGNVDASHAGEEEAQALISSIETESQCPTKYLE